MEEIVRKRSRENRLSNIQIKGLLIAGISVLMLLLLLFSNLLNYMNGGIAIKISGLNAVMALFYGSRVGYYLYGELVYLNIPVYVTVMYLATLAALVVAVVYAVVNMLWKNKDGRFLGYYLLAVGGVVVLFYIFLLTTPVCRVTNLEGENVVFYRAFELSVSYFLAGILSLLTGFVQLFLSPKRIPRIKKFWVFYLLLIAPTVVIFIFGLYPIFLQVILAFKDYRLADGIWGSEWIGLGNFIYMVTDSQILTVIWQTVYLSLLRLVAGIVPSVFFALVFYDMGVKRYRKAVQTIVYIPHFFSWVIIYAIVSTFLQPQGIVNNILTQCFGMEPIDFLSQPNLFYPNMILSSIWKEVGWGTILYLAALSAVDPSLFEAAAIDGAGVFRKLWHITLPGMIPIIVFQTIMSIGNLLKSAGGEQVLIFATGSVKNNKALVIDTWLYWQGLGELKYGLSAAVSFAQSVIGFLMVVGSHKLSKRLVGIGAW